MEHAPSAADTKLLVIGYGNTLRSDDGVGPYVAQAIEALNLPGVRALACGLLAPELADPVSRSGSVVFVDASVESMSNVRLRQLAPAESSQILAHAADPRTLLALARDVFGRAPRGWWLTVPVENLGVGEALSAKALGGAQEAITEIRRILARV